MGGSGGGYARNHGVNVGNTHVNVGGGHHHHHHHSYSSSGWHFGGYSRHSSCSGIISFCFFVVLIIVVSIVLLFSPTTSKIGLLSPMEQLIVCPSSAKKNAPITVASSTTTAVATLVSKLPAIGPSGSTRKQGDTSWLMSSNYKYYSFNLVKGSKVQWSIVSKSITAFKFYLVFGQSELQSFVNGQNFRFVKTSNDQIAADYHIAANDGEYIAIVYAEWGSVSFSSHEYIVEHTRYMAELTAVANCSTCHLETKSVTFPGACVIFESLLNSSSFEASVSVSVPSDNTTLYIVCGVVAGILALAFIVSLSVCTYCLFKERKGTQGQTYQQIPSSPGFQPPPISPEYQQPQAVPVYPQATAFNPGYGAAPAY